MHFVCLTRITSEHSVKGGMEVHQQILAEGLAKRGHKITVVTSRGIDGFVGEKDIAGVTYVFTNMPRFTSLAKWYPLWYSKKSGIIEKIHERNPIDCVWGEGASAYGAISVLQKLRIPYVPIAQGTIPGDLLSYFRQINSLVGVAKFIIWLMIRSYFLFFYEHKYLNSAAKVVAVSNELKADMIRYYSLDPNHIEIIYNGVSPDIFTINNLSRNSFRREIGIPEDSFVAVCAGRLIREKGFHIVLESMPEVIAKYPNTYLLILGKGVYESELKIMAQRLKVADHVYFLGFISRDTIATMYNAADCLIAATLRNEGLPLIFCEAMLCGLPIIASMYGGNPTAVHDGETGLLLERPEASVVREAWLQLIASPEYTKILASGARSFALENFTDSVMTENTEKLFLKVIHDNS